MASPTAGTGDWRRREEIPPSLRERASLFTLSPAIPAAKIQRLRNTRTNPRAEYRRPKGKIPKMGMTTAGPSPGCRLCLVGIAESSFFLSNRNLLKSSPGLPCSAGKYVRIDCMEMRYKASIQCVRDQRQHCGVFQPDLGIGRYESDAPSSKYLVGIGFGCQFHAHATGVGPGRRSPRHQPLPTQAAGSAAQTTIFRQADDVGPRW